MGRHNLCSSENHKSDSFCTDVDDMSGPKSNKDYNNKAWKNKQHILNWFSILPIP